jgi:putative redox protein
MNTAKISPKPGTKFAQSVVIGRHQLTADEKAPEGEDLGPEPFEWILSGLANCTAFTLRMYAKRKTWPLNDVKVECDGQRGDDGKLTITRRIHLDGPLDAEQMKRLMEIADRCPVHRALSQPSVINSSAF